jgi:hypothetical protein
MTTETTRVNGSNGTQARRFALHELPIPGAADSLRKVLAIASHRRPIPPIPRHPERCSYNASRAIRWVLKQAVRAFHGTAGIFED